MSPAVITAQTKASHGLAFLLSGGRVGWGQDQGWLPVSLSLGPGWRPRSYTWSEWWECVVQFFRTLNRGTGGCGAASGGGETAKREASLMLASCRSGA